MKCILSTCLFKLLLSLHRLGQKVHWNMGSLLHSYSWCLRSEWRLWYNLSQLAHGNIGPANQHNTSLLYNGILKFKFKCIFYMVVNCSYMVLKHWSCEYLFYPSNKLWNLTIFYSYSIVILRLFHSKQWQQFLLHKK